MLWTFPQIGVRFPQFAVAPGPSTEDKVVLVLGASGEESVMTRMRTVIGALTGALAMGVATAGCASAAAAHVAAQNSVTCGTVRTAGGATAIVTVSRGRPGCAAVRRVLAGYYADLAAGKAPGMGGGGPVAVDGWRCLSGPATSPGTTCRSGNATVKASMAG
jgi:hypothetical protein